jgi:hypothetical protein
VATGTLTELAVRLGETEGYGARELPGLGLGPGGRVVVLGVADGS